MDDFFNDVYGEESSEEEFVFMPKLDIDKLLREAEEPNVAVQTCNESGFSAWASQFIANHVMIKHHIDQRIKQGDVPEFPKWKKFVKKEFKFNYQTD